MAPPFLFEKMNEKNHDIKVLPSGNVPELPCTYQTTCKYPVPKPMNTKAN
jgi:hypothetical protein